MKTKIRTSEKYPLYANLIPKEETNFKGKHNFFSDNLKVISE